MANCRYKLNICLHAGGYPNFSFDTTVYEPGSHTLNVGFVSSDQMFAEVNLLTSSIIVTGSGKKAILLRFKYQMIEQRIAYALMIIMLSLHIPLFIPELCVLETQSSEIVVLKRPLLNWEK